MAEIKRKLAAIVFTDIVGFTKLSAENEPVALELLNRQREILKPIVDKYNGEWLKEIGDGLLLSFSTNREAVDCAITIQNAVSHIDTLVLRIGIHQGEVVFQGNDIVGKDRSRPNLQWRIRGGKRRCSWLIGEGAWQTGDLGRPTGLPVEEPVDRGDDFTDHRNGYRISELLVADVAARMETKALGKTHQPAALLGV